VAVEHLPEGAVTGFMRPDWLIFSDLANLMGGPALNYHAPADVQRDIQKAVPGFQPGNRKPRRMRPLECASPPSAGEERMPAVDFVAVAEPGGYRHRGIDIASKVGGLSELALEEGFRMHPEDVARLGLKEGDVAILAFERGRARAEGKVRPDKECPRGAIYFTRPVVFGGLEERRGLWPFFGLDLNPIPVTVSRKGDSL